MLQGFFEVVPFASNFFPLVSFQVLTVFIEIKETIVRKIDNKDIDKLVYLKEEAAGKIDRISDDRYKVILSMYYLSNETFEAVAERTGMSFQWVHTLHKKALKEFEKILNS